MIEYLLDKHFITLGLTIGFMMKLRAQKSVGDTQLRYFWLTVVSTMILVAADSLEYWAQLSADRIFWRMLFSVIGYCFRPIAALSVTLVVYPGFHRPRLIWIPAAANILIYCTAFFSPVAFRINDDNTFTRGPLGFSVFIVCFFYIACILWLKHKRFRSRKREGAVLYFCAVICVIAAVLDYFKEGSRINATVMMSSIFLYVFLRSFDMNRDPLTRLLNRFSFYEDCQRFGTSISGVAMIDMNGLKKLNDDYGHDKGDRALKAIGESIRQTCGRKTPAYRIGGDEFVILFLRQEEQAVRDALDMLRAIVRERGYSVSAGYMMRRDKNDTVQDLVRWADEEMYREKAEYYRQSGHDRRRN